jgi:hypothetical protein
MYSLKTPLRFVFLPLAVLFLTAAGCENGLLGDDKQKPNRHYWEVEINDKKKMIEQTVKGIEFKFCLLNENSVPSTVFEEGENFFFYFTVKNTLHEKLYFDKDFMRFDFHTFCKVWEINGNSVGKPFVFRGIDKIGVGAYPFPQNETYAFKFPWLYDFELWNSLFRYNKELLFFRASLKKSASRKFVSCNFVNFCHENK